MANNPKEASIPILLGELVSAGDEHLQQGVKEDKIFRATPISGKLAIYGWALPIERRSVWPRAESSTAPYSGAVDQGDLVVQRIEVNYESQPENPTRSKGINQPESHIKEPFTSLRLLPVACFWRGIFLLTRSLMGDPWITVNFCAIRPGRLQLGINLALTFNRLLGTEADLLVVVPGRNEAIEKRPLAISAESKNIRMLTVC